MADTPIELFFDVVSPYSYLAVQRIDALAERTGRAILWRPFFLGGVLQTAGNRMPAAVPNKARALLDDLRRSAAQLGVPFAYQAAFPFNSIPHQRALFVLAGRDQPACATAARRLFAAFWAEEADPADPAVLAAAVAAAGHDPAEVLAATQTAAVKEGLKAASDEAVARGAFGAPTFFVGDRMWWGHDRMDLLALCLERGLP